MSPEPCLTFTNDLWRTLVCELHRRTAGVHESGAFLLGTLDGLRRHVREIVYYDDLDGHAYDTGVVVLHGDAFARLWDMCAARSLAVVGDVHVYGLGAGQSSARSLLGGVTVIGATGPLRVSLPGSANLEQAVCALGARVVTDIDPSAPAIIIGDAEIGDVPDVALRVTFDGWSGGVVPARSSARLLERGDFTPAGVLAGALAVSEVFQQLRRSYPLAGRRVMGLSLWRPERDWRNADCDDPPLERLPASAWLVGLGNLGQAYLWTLGLLPYGENARPTFVLQDFDILAPSNLSTSLLTTETQLGIRKSRAMANWAEARGFETTIIERPFAADFHVAAMEPIVALIGVDNPLARRQVEDVGFGRVIEAGLGKGPQDFLGFNMHSFPASRPACECWLDDTSVETSLDQPAYRALVKATGDQCGTLQLAGRTVGAPFVGAVAGALVVSELVRLTLGAHRYEYLSCHLRGLDRGTIIGGDPWPISNPGSVPRSDWPEDSCGIG